MTEEPRAPLMEHLEELRKRLIKSAAAVAAGSVVAFVFRNRIFEWLVQPYVAVVGDDGLAFFQVTEAFSVVMRLSLFGGIVLTSPILFYQVWAFVSPGLTSRERKWAVPVVSMLVILFLAGVGFAYWSLPRGLEFLLGIAGPSLVPIIGVASYLSFATRFLLVFGLAFEFPVFLFAAALAGFVTPTQLARGRRWALLIIVTLGAIITPSGDPLTLTLLSAPLYLLYELTILATRLAVRRR